MVLPVNLGRRQMLIGGQPLPQMPMQQQGMAGDPLNQRRQVGDDKSQRYGDSARAYGLAEALSPIEINGGGWGEAIAEALAGGLRGRAAQSQRQTEVDTEERQRADGQKEQTTQRVAISDALAGFDPNNPQGMIEALRTGAPEEALSLAAALAGREPQEQWSEPFDQGGVQVQRSSTSNQLRTVGNPPAAMIYQPPAGYRGSPDAGLEPIPGGPADVRASAEGRSRMQQMDSSIRQLQSAIDVLGEAEGQVNGMNSGMAGQIMRGMGGTGAYDLNQALEPVRSILSFETLAEMRRNSSTGSALGSIAVRELELLANTVRSLDTAQSADQLRRNLGTTRAQLQRTLSAVQAAREEMGQPAGAAPMEPMAPEPQGQQPRVMQWSPERGVY